MSHPPIRPIWRLRYNPACPASRPLGSRFCLACFFENECSARATRSAAPPKPHSRDRFNLSPAGVRRLASAMWSCLNAAWTWLSVLTTWPVIDWEEVEAHRRRIIGVGRRRVIRCVCHHGALRCTQSRKDLLLNLESGPTCYVCLVGRCSCTCDGCSAMQVD